MYGHKLYVFYKVLVPNILFGMTIVARYMNFLVPVIQIKISAYNMYMLARGKHTHDAYEYRCTTQTELYLRTRPFARKSNLLLTRFSCGRLFDS